MRARPLAGQSTVRLTAGQALVRFLASQFSERDGCRRRLVPAMLGIFGHGNVCGLGQALEEDEGRTMRYLQPKNEQAMVHAAMGYARARQRLSTLACSASIGPGSTNMLTGAAAATVNRVPVLLLPSDTFASRLQGPPMQSLDDPARGDVSVNDAFRPVSVFFDRIARPEQLLAALPAAVAALLDPDRTGAVTLSLHQDVQAEAWDFPEAFFAERTWTVARRPPAAEELAAAAEALLAAERPLIVAGGGVRYSDAGESLRRLAGDHSIPVAETSAGKGALRGDSPMAVGGIGHSGTRAANHLARQADLVLCAGTRLIDLTTGSGTLFEEPRVRFVGLNVSAFDARKLGADALQADARLGLEALAGELDRRGRTSSEAWPREVAAAKDDWRAAVEADKRPREGERMSQHQVVHALNRAARPGDTLVVASGTPHVDVHKLWDTAQGAEVQMEVGFSTMGHEIPGALGVRMSQGADGEVWVLIGDGTYLMGHTELVTAVQERLKVTVVLVDNHGYQSIHALQRARLDRSFGLEFRAREEGALTGEHLAVDYAGNARSYGCASFEADTPDQVERALEDARRQDLPSVIVCRTEPHRLTLDSDCWWDVGVAEVSSRPETVEAAARSAEGRAKMRWHG